MFLRRLIIISLMIPTFIFVFFIFRLWYERMDPDRTDFDLTILALQTSRDIDLYEVAPPDPRASMLILQDTGFDRNWNSGNHRSYDGRKLADYFAEEGITVYRYDRPDPVKGHWVSVSEQAEEIKTIIEIIVRRNNHIMQSEPIAEDGPHESNPEPGQQVSQPLKIFAHGEGCYNALYTLSQNPSLVDQRTTTVYLTGCISLNLLRKWTEQLLYNMEVLDADPEIQKTAREEAYAWMQGPFRPTTQTEIDELENAENLHNDLILFRRGLFTATSPENIEWTEQATDLNFFDLIEQLNQQNIEIVLLHSEYDEELPPQEVEKAIEIAETIEHPLFRFEILENTDHFLKVRDSQADGPLQSAMRRRDPFANFTPELKEIIE